VSTSATDTGATRPGRLALVRHGQTEWSRSGQHTSVTDLDLTGAGEREAEQLAGLLAGLGVRPRTVLSSPRMRALRTATLAGFTVDELVDDLVEWNYGQYEGRTTADIHTERPGWDIFHDGAPDGESPEDVAARADRALEHAWHAAVDGGDVVLFSHGHMSRALAVRWAGMPIAAGSVLAMDAAAVTVLKLDRGVRMIDHANVVPLRPAGA
jgi:probable phosphoglycerate mutase